MREESEWMSWGEKKEAVSVRGKLITQGELPSDGMCGRRMLKKERQDCGKRAVAAAAGRIQWQHRIRIRKDCEQKASNAQMRLRTLRRTTCRR